MKTKSIKISLTMFGLFCVLLNYQNCSPVAGTEDLGQAPSTQEGIIDPMNIGQIDFMQEKVNVAQDDTDLSVFGICSSEQSGSLIGWKIYDSTSTQMFKGRSVCDLGSFEVALEGLDTIPCGEQFELHAALGAKAKSQVIIEKSCTN